METYQRELKNYPFESYTKQSVDDPMDGMNIFIFFFTFHYRCYTLNLDNIGSVVTGKNVKITQCIYKR